MNNLIHHIRENSSRLDPLPTYETATLPPTPLLGMRAVIFDIYGTLFISGSGDISLAKKEDRSPAIVAALETAGYTISKPDENWSGIFMETLEDFRKQRADQGIEFPEVRIQEVWTAFIESARSQDWLCGNSGVDMACPEPVEWAIVDHECRVNPCWPMPSLDPTLRWIRDNDLELGIVSNAQFYTPLLFPALMGKDLEGYGFNPAYSVWSYMEREGKPSRNLYRKLKEKLAKDNIVPGEVLYVGNDLRNDIWPAQRLGFRTALFAGDDRSLRWRQDDPACQDVRPDFVITDLEQIREIV
jgi:putative hydrolase of the HAD superfamily